MKRGSVAFQRERHTWLERLLGRRAQMPPAAASDDCLDAETLAAWVDGALGKKDLAAAESHASSCTRCTMLLASIVRTAPVSDPAADAPAWGLPLRWLVPLAATATAIAIWVAIPEQQVTPVSREATLPSVAAEPPAALPAAPAPSDALLATPRVEAPAPAQKELGARADSLRTQDRDEAQDVRQKQAREVAAPVPESRNAAPVSAAAEAPASIGAAMLADKVNEPLRRTLLEKSGAVEAMTPDSMIRWHVVTGLFVERSSDGGKSWVRTASPAGVAPNSSPSITIVAILAVDALSATVTTSDGRILSTTDGGATWSPVQGNPAAPF